MVARLNVLLSIGGHHFLHFLLYYCNLAIFVQLAFQESQNPFS